MNHRRKKKLHCLDFFDVAAFLQILIKKKKWLAFQHLHQWTAFYCITEIISNIVSRHVK